MAKNNKKKNNYNFVPQPKKSERLAQQAEAEETKVATNDEPDNKVETTKAQPDTTATKGKDKQSKGKGKSRREHKPSRLVKGVKEMGSELKKVSWPTFRQVVKQTGIVIVVVLFFTLILLGLDTVGQQIYKLLGLGA